MSGSPTLYPIQALSSSDQPLISILSKSYRHSLHFPLRKPPLCAEISQLDTNGMIMGERLHKKTFLTKDLFFPVFNEERGHLVHKLRDHDDNVVEEKHERGTCLQRLWTLPQTAQCKQLPLFPFISVFLKHLLQRTLPRCRGPRL